MKKPLTTSHSIIHLTLLLGLGVGSSACASAPRSAAESATSTMQAERAHQRVLTEALVERAQLATTNAHHSAQRWADGEAARPALAEALERSRRAQRQTADYMGAWWSDPDAEDPRVVLTAFSEPSASISRGTTAGGEVLGSSMLPLKGPYHEVVARAQGRKTNWGTPELVSMIQDAAKAVRMSHPGSVLSVGNLSVKQGGDIRWSRSHNSGRDADLAFYSRDASTGKAVITPDLIAFDDDGKAIGHELVFDVPRNWLLARALITHPAAEVQYLFISLGLKQKLLDHAARIGEPAELIEQAASILHQPTDALPHDDHFHLRIACTREDRLLGCLDRGPEWAWSDRHREALLHRTLTMRKALEGDDAELRQQALDYLLAVESPYAPDLAMTTMATHPDPAVRARTLELANSVYRWTGTALAATQNFILRAETDSSERIRAYSILRRSLDPMTIDFLKARLTDPDVSSSEKVYAARALTHQMEPELVPFLLARLGVESSGSVREEVASVLRKITVRSEPIDWRAAGDKERAKALVSWSQWWETNRYFEREVWIAEALATYGVDKEMLFTAQSVDRLLELLPSVPEHVLYNVNKTLRKVTGRWAPLEQTNGYALQSYWERWWKRNRDRMLASS